MTTEWFKNDGSGVAVHSEDPTIVLVGDYIPDWILVPDESPERAGEKLKVLSHGVGACPKCRVNTVRILRLEHDYRVAECKPGCGFVFYRLSVHRASVDKAENAESDARYGDLMADEEGENG